MMNRLLFASLAASAALTAQRPVVFPPEYDVAWGRGSSAALGGNSTRTQMIVANPFPAGTPVFGFGLRATTGTVDRAAFTADIEVRISSTTAVPGALSTTFANNVGSDEVVILPRQIVNIPAMPANRSTGTFAQILFPAPFTFGTNNAPNICVELLVYGRSTGATWSTDRAFAATTGRAATAGIGCGTGTITSTSTGGTYVSGATINLSLAGGQPNSLALLLASFDQKESAPGVLLPFDLGAVGLGTGCALLVNPSLGANALFTDAAGAATSSVAVPPGFGQFGLGWQWAYQVPTSPTNLVGLETTASRATWIGPEVVTPNAQYVWDLSNVAAVTGNATTNSVPVVMFLVP